MKNIFSVPVVLLSIVLASFCFFSCKPTPEEEFERLNKLQERTKYIPKIIKSNPDFSGAGHLETVLAIPSKFWIKESVDTVIKTASYFSGSEDINYFGETFTIKSHTVFFVVQNDTLQSKTFSVYIPSKKIEECYANPETDYSSNLQQLKEIEADQLRLQISYNIGPYLGKRNFRIEGIFFFQREGRFDEMQPYKN